jgi:hypothetical protein
MDLFEALSNFFIALYLIPLSLIPLCFELTRNQTSGCIRSRLERYFGFIFLFKARYKYLIFLGMLILGNCNEDYGGESGRLIWPTLIVGIVVLLDAVFHIVVRIAHPEFDDQMVTQLEQAADARAGTKSAPSAPSAPGSMTVPQVPQRFAQPGFGQPQQLSQPGFGPGAEFHGVQPGVQPPPPVPPPPGPTAI